MHQIQKDAADTEMLQKQTGGSMGQDKTERRSL